MNKPDTGVTAILVTFSILAAIMILAFGIAYLSTTNYQIASNLRANTQARYVAEAGIDYVAGIILSKNNIKHANGATDGKTYYYYLDDGSVATIKFEIPSDGKSMPTYINVTSTGTVPAANAEYVTSARIGRVLSSAPCPPTSCIKRKGIVANGSINLSNMTLATYNNITVAVSEDYRAATPTNYYDSDPLFVASNGGNNAISLGTTGTGITTKTNAAITIPPVGYTVQVEAAINSMGTVVTVGTNTTISSQADFDANYKNKSVQFINTTTPSSKVNLTICKGINLSSTKLYATGNITFSSSCGSGSKTTVGDNATLIAHDPTSTTATASGFVGLDQLGSMGGYSATSGRGSYLYSDADMTFTAATLTLNGQGYLRTRGNLKYTGTLSGDSNNLKACPAPAVFYVDPSVSLPSSLPLSDPSILFKTYCLAAGTPTPPTLDSRGVPTAGEVWNQGWHFEAEKNIYMIGAGFARLFMKTDADVSYTDPVTGTQGSFRPNGGGIEAGGNIQMAGSGQVQTRWEDDIWQSRYYPANTPTPTYRILSRR